MREVEIGKEYVCQAIGFNHLVVGTIERVYTNTVMLKVDKYHKTEEKHLMACHFKVLVKYSEVLRESNALTKEQVVSL
ncbi:MULTISPECIES: hypothetical protein [unclassified Enterococcus]|uniref:hypothetical protein n=1 Tax=unclassified Enterococcus TaxID=2608891 RepID=UPI002476B2B0|nr:MULTISPECIES: hypothetical protein [unclassified Enterococcus]